MYTTHKPWNETMLYISFESWWLRVKNKNIQKYFLHWLLFCFILIYEAEELYDINTTEHRNSHIFTDSVQKHFKYFGRFLHFDLHLLWIIAQSEEIKAIKSRLESRGNFFSFSFFHCFNYLCNFFYEEYVKNPL